VGPDVSLDSGSDASDATGATCGNNTAEGAEACDGTDLKGATCATRGFAVGVLRCASNCSGYDEASCGDIVINEINSNVDPPGDYVEFYNKSATKSIDISGWYFTDNAPATANHTITFPANTVVGPHGFISILTNSNPGLGPMDSVIFSDSAGHLVEQRDWTTHRITDSRCPDGTGDFVNNTAATPGAANACGDGGGADGGDGG
jgi:hypothetical protein